MTDLRATNTDYPENFRADLSYLSDYYKWSAADKTGIRQMFTGKASGVRYFQVLAAAHRAGYVQDESTGWVRLGAWCAVKGLGDPFAPDFDLAKLQALAFTQLETA
jgi:hypothetical protein